MTAQQTPSTTLLKIARSGAVLIDLTRIYAAGDAETSNRDVELGHHSGCSILGAYVQRPERFRHADRVRLLLMPG